jgi:hypothetical protein
MPGEKPPLVASATVPSLGVGVTDWEGEGAGIEGAPVCDDAGEREAVDDVEALSVGATDCEGEGFEDLEGVLVGDVACGDAGEGEAVADVEALGVGIRDCEAKGEGVEELEGTLVGEVDCDDVGEGKGVEALSVGVADCEGEGAGVEGAPVGDDAGESETVDDVEALGVGATDCEGEGVGEGEGVKGPEGTLVGEVDCDDVGKGEAGDDVEAPGAEGDRVGEFETVGEDSKKTVNVSVAGMLNARACGSNSLTATVPTGRLPDIGSVTAKRAVPSRSGRSVKPHVRVGSCQMKCIPSRASVP